MRKCSVGGQAVMEGVMMKSPDGIAMAVRRPDGSIATEYKRGGSRAKKGTFLGLPVVRGVVSFVETLGTGMDTITRSAELAGVDAEEPTKFEKWLEKKLGKSADKLFMGFAVVLAVALALGLFVLLPTFLTDLIYSKSSVSGFARSLTAGAMRLAIFVGYLFLCGSMKDIKRVFMYHGAEHKTIACYEAEEELTPENAMKYRRLHPRCGTNYLFLVMAISILFFAVVGWSDNKLILFGTRILLLPVVAGVSYEVLKLAAASDNILCRIVRAPGMALQLITTREPTPDMIEVAIAALELALDPAKARRPSAAALAHVHGGGDTKADAEAEAGETAVSAPAPEAVPECEAAVPADGEPADA